jgi:hypothetical protein
MEMEASSTRAIADKKAQQAWITAQLAMIDARSRQIDRQLSELYRSMPKPSSPFPVVLLGAAVGCACITAGALLALFAQ